MTTLSLDKFNLKLLTLDDNVWTNPVGESTTLLYQGERHHLIKLPPMEVKYGCQDYKGNQKYTMTLEVEPELQEKFAKIEKRLTELIKTPITLVKDGKLKVKMQQDKEGDLTTRMFNSDSEPIPLDPSSIPPRSVVRVALHLKSIFKNSVGYYPQLFASQVMVKEQKPVQEELGCVF